VLIDRNLILGNLAGAGDAGGVRISNLNGEDVAADGADRSSWDTVQLINNWIVNNVAGLAGGAISLENSAAVDILHNTIANNDSIATAGLAFAPGSPNVSTRQPAGIVARAHSSALAALFTGAAADAYGVFSNPRLANNTIWHNRQFNFFVNDGGSPPFGLSPDVEADPGSEVFSDLAVLPAGTGQLEPRNCVLSDTPANRAAYTGDFNIFGDPGFVRSYSNGRLGQHVLIPEFKTSLAAVPAFDEGGNMIDVRYGPLALRDPTTSLRYGDYHLTPCAAAKDVGDGTPLAGAPLELATDIDGDERPELGTAVDIGADENFGFCDDACPQDPAKTEPGICGCGVPDTDGDGDGTADCVDGCPADPDKTAPGDCGCGTPETDTDGDSSPDCVDLCDDDPLKTDPGDCGCGNPDVDADGSGVSDCLELGDVVEIVLARYQPFGPTVGGLTVWAISSETPSVSLFLQGYGEMDYFPSEGPYYVFERIVFGGVGPTVTVNSSGGGTDTVSIPFPSGAPNQTTPGRGPERIGRTGQRPISASIGSLFGRYSGSRRSLSAKLDSGGPVDPDPGTASTPDPDAPLGIGGDEISKGTSPIEYAVPTVATLPASIAVQCPGDLDGDAIIDAPDPAHPNAKCMHITAGDSFLRMADEQPGGRPIYAFGFSDVTGIPEDQVMEQGILAGQFPAPLIAVDEGDELYLTMTNVGMLIRPDLFDPHTVHWHGFPNAADIFDGLPEVTISINMGASLTYYYNVVHPGTYMYHCHVEATEHMQMGMLGNLYVRPAQNGTVFGDPDGSGRSYDKFVYNDGDGSTGYDVEYPIQIGSFDSAFHDASETVQPLPFAEMRDDYPLLNGRGYPDTINTATFVNDAGKPTQIEHSLIRAVAGEKVLLRISNLNVTRHYTLGTLGIPMRVVGMDARLARGPGGEDLSYSTNSVTLGGGQSVDVILDTLGIPPGTYFLFTTNLNYLSNSDEDLGGMMTEIVVEPAVP
jgi:hypothetical protein